MKPSRICAAQPYLKSRNEKGFWYDQYRLGTKVVQRYLGEDSEELRDRIARHTGIRERARESRRQRGTLVRLLKAEGFLPVDVMSGPFLAALARAGVFRLGGTLIGTQAFRLCEGELGVRISSGRMAATMDMDIASFERLALVLDDRVDPALDEIFHDFSFEPVPGLDHGNVWRWRQTRQRTLVKFLAPSFEADEGIRDLPTLGVRAQALHHLNYLIAEPLDAAVLYRDGALVRIPRPERYAIHKLCVADRRRGGPDAMKSRKDRDQAAFLVEVLGQEQPDALAEAYEHARASGPAWGRRIRNSLAGMPRTAGILDRLPS